jgi:hypothetical protein
VDTVLYYRTFEGDIPTLQHPLALYTQLIMGSGGGARARHSWHEHELGPVYCELPVLAVLSSNKL